MILPRRLRVAPLLLTLLLLAGPLSAATTDRHWPGEAWQSRLSVTGVLSEAWALVSRIWEKEGSGIDPFGKAGSSTDPFGNHTPNTTPPHPGTTLATSRSASGN